MGFNRLPALKEWPNACNVNLYVGTDGLSWHADVASLNCQGAKKDEVSWVDTQNGDPIII